MALSQVSSGDLILAAHHNSIVQLLTGVAGSGESVTFVYNAAPALAFKPSSNPVALTEAIQIQNAAGTVLGSITFDGYVHAASGAVGNPGFSFRGDTNTGVFRSAADTVDIAAGGVRAAQFSTVASAVNYLDIAPSATGNAVTVTAEGTDTNVSINLIPKGSGTVQAAGSQVLAHSLADAKGDIIVATADNTFTRLAVGTNNQVLTADSTQATGVKWAAGLSITTAEADLGADVTIAAANTFYDGPSVSLTAGTWFVVGTVTVRSDADGGTTKEYTAKLWDGTTNEASAGFSKSASVDVQFCMTVSGIVSPGSTTTYKISVAANAVDAGNQDKILAASLSNNAGNTASHIRAIKVA